MFLENIDIYPTVYLIAFTRDELLLKSSHGKFSPLRISSRFLKHIYTQVVGSCTIKVNNRSNYIYSRTYEKLNIHELHIRHFCDSVLQEIIVMIPFSPKFQLFICRDFN